VSKDFTVEGLIAAEMRKIVTVSKDRVNMLKEAIADGVCIQLPIDVVQLQRSESGGLDTQGVWDTHLGFHGDQSAQYRVVAASIMSYITINAEALRKIGKKVDKCLSLAHGSFNLDLSDEERKKVHTTQQRIIIQLNTLLIPIIDELKKIDRELHKKQFEVHHEDKIDQQKHQSPYTNTPSEKEKQMKDILSKLSGRGDLFESQRDLFGLDESNVSAIELEIDMGLGLDMDIDNDNLVDVQLENLTKEKSEIMDILNQSKWLFLMALFCLIVGFQPVFANLTLDSEYNEATVVLVEAMLSAAVGLAFASYQNGWDGYNEVLSWSNVLFFAPTGILRAMEDTLSILVLRYIDPLTYIVISQLRLSLTALLSYIYLEKKPTLLEGQNVGIITVGLLLFGLTDSENSDDSSSSERSESDYILGLILLIIAVICKVLASVYVDFALKSRKHLTIPMQSANISLATLLPSLLFALIIANIDKNKSMNTLFDGWNVLVGVFTVYILTKNWMSNTIIKRFSAITKYSIYALAMLVTFVFEISLGYRTFSAITFFVLLLIGYGVYLYAQSKSTIESIVSSTISTMWNVEGNGKGEFTEDKEQQNQNSDKDSIGIDVEESNRGIELSQRRPSR
jgi:solute carrier family 35 (probable UDP-sugar transporter), member A4